MENNLKLNSFQFYKSLKAKFSFCYRGYNMRDVMAADVARCCYGMPLDAFSYLAKKAVSRVASHRLLEAEGVRESVVFSFGYYGADHRALLDAIVKRVDKPIVLREGEGERPVLALLTLFRSTIEILKWVSFSGLSLRQIVYLALKLTQYCALIDELETRLNWKLPRAYVAFLSAVGFDAVYCQYFRKRGVRTFCVQHGLFGSSVSYKRFVPYDVINLENLQAEYMLGWGQYTLRCMLDEGIQPERFVLAGNPKLLHLPLAAIKRTPLRICLLCLARDLYDKGNLALLQIASRLAGTGLTVFVKMHPRSNTESYSRLAKQHGLQVLPVNGSLSEMISKFSIEFSVVYNSTIYYECYRHSIPTFRFGFEENDIPFGLDDQFLDFETLMDKIAKLKGADLGQLSVEVREMLDYICDPNADEYARVLDEKAD